MEIEIKLYNNRTEVNHKHHVTVQLKVERQNY